VKAGQGGDAAGRCKDGRARHSANKTRAKQAPGAPPPTQANPNPPVSAVYRLNTPPVPRKYSCVSPSWGAYTTHTMPDCTT
jgi:hypothetical protein